MGTVPRDAAAPLRVLIFGSCVSRDVFEHLGPEDGIELAEYVARSSLVSAMSKRPFTGVDTAAIESAFRRSRVEWDLGSTKLRQLVRDGDFDILLMDLIDERYPLFQRGRECFATVTDEFRESGFQRGAERDIGAYSDERFQLWQRAWRRWVRLLRRAGALGKLRVGRVYWSTMVSKTVPYPPAAADPNGYRRVNDSLDQMYRHMARDLRPEQFYRYPEAALYAAENHKWGSAPYHWGPAYEEALKAHLLAER
ncbi:MAG: DUF6270 domain-containing protein [Bifidobacteriaceae bacterium]|nr:DUF6270 domain-containing protein [Bifidobacteriaceae bacterium]